MAGVEHLLVMEAPVGAFQDRVSEALIYGIFVAKLDEAIPLESQRYFWKGEWQFPDKWVLWRLGAGWEATTAVSEGSLET